MILTEEEAEAKRCQESFGSQAMAPMGAFPSTMHAVAAAPMSPMNCIGSACMAWRWHGDWGDRPVDESVLKHWERNGWVKVEDPFLEVGTVAIRFNGRRDGYCGKAGKP